MNKSVSLLAVPFLATFLFACPVTPTPPSDTCAVVISSANQNTSISSATTWTNSSSACDYLVKNDFRADLAVLTIEAGTVIEFEAGVQLHIGGTIIANGSSSNRIVFRGAAETSGFWRGIKFQTSNTSNQMSFVTVKDAGSSTTQQAAIELFGSRLTLTDSLITNNKYNGLLGSQTTDLSGFARNTFTGNGLSGLQITPHQLKQLDDATNYNGDKQQPNTQPWISLTTGTLLGGDITSMVATRYRIINSFLTDGTLNIAPGTILEFNEGAFLQIGIGATLNAVGTSTNRIQFVGANGVSGFWRGIDILSNKVNHLEYSDVKFAGSSTNYQGAVRLFNGAALTISHSDFSTNKYFGIFRFNTNTILNDDLTSTFSANGSGDINTP